MTGYDPGQRRLGQAVRPARRRPCGCTTDDSVIARYDYDGHGLVQDGIDLDDARLRHGARPDRPRDRGATPARSPWTRRRAVVTDRLYRSRDDRMIAGVAGGVAEHLDADPSIIRIVWVAADHPDRRARPARLHRHGHRRPRGARRLGCRPDGRAGTTAPSGPVPAGGRVGPDGAARRRPGRRRPVADGRGDRPPRPTPDAPPRPARSAAAPGSSSGSSSSSSAGSSSSASSCPPSTLDLWLADRPRSGSASCCVVLAVRPRRAVRVPGPTAASRTMGRVDPDDRPVGRGARRRRRRRRPRPAGARARRLPDGDPGRRHVDLDDRLARGRRGPRQRGHRAGRADARLAAPERARASTTARPSATAATTDAPSAGYTEERSIGFRVRDATGSLRVFPRGARIDAPGPVRGRRPASLGDEPAGPGDADGERPRRGRPSSTARRAIAELLRGPATRRTERRWPASRRPARPRDVPRGPARAGRRRSRSSGGRSPSPTWPIPAGADIGSGADAARLDDPEVAADLAEARAAGTLADDPAAAWGNAAIPGFGIGRPVASPDIDPAANPLPLADADEAARAERTFEIAPETLVLAASDEVPLLIAYGVPGRGRPSASRTASSSACSGPSWRSSRRWSSPSRSAAGSAREPARVRRRLRRRRSSSLVVGFIVLASYNAVVALRQRIDKAWANIDVVLKQRHDQLPNLVAAVRGLMAFEQDVLTEVTEARAAYAPTAPIPDQAGDVGGDQRRGPLAVRRRRALPGHQVGGQRAGPPGRDRAARGDDRRPPRALQRPGLPLQHADRAGARRTLLAPVFGWRPREFFAATPAETERPDTSLGGPGAESEEARSQVPLRQNERLARAEATVLSSPSLTGTLAWRSKCRREAPGP